MRFAIVTMVLKVNTDGQIKTSLKHNLNTKFGE